MTLLLWSDLRGSGRVEASIGRGAPAERRLQIEFPPRLRWIAGCVHRSLSRHGRSWDVIDRDHPARGSETLLLAAKPSESSLEPSYEALVL